MIAIRYMFCTGQSCARPRPVPGLHHLELSCRMARRPQRQPSRLFARAARGRLAKCQHPHAVCTHCNVFLVFAASVIDPFIVPIALDHGVAPLLTPAAVILPLPLGSPGSCPDRAALTPAAVVTFSTLPPSPFAWLAREGGQFLAADGGQGKLGVVEKPPLGPSGNGSRTNSHWPQISRTSPLWRWRRSLTYVHLSFVFHAARGSGPEASEFGPNNRSGRPASR